MFDLFLMSNLGSTDTGVEGVVLWVAAGEFAAMDVQHGPRLLVLLGEEITTERLKNAVSARLTAPPAVLGVLPGKVQEQVLRFVELNRDILLRHWNGEIGTRALLDRLQKV